MTAPQEGDEVLKDGQRAVIGSGDLLGASSGEAVNLGKGRNDVLSAILKGYLFLLIIVASTNDGAAKQTPLPINDANVCGNAPLRWNQPVRYAVVSSDIVVKLTGGTNLLLNKVTEGVRIGDATTDQGGEIAKNQPKKHRQEERSYLWWWLTHIGGLLFGLFLFASGLVARVVNALTPNVKDLPRSQRVRTGLGAGLS